MEISDKFEGERLYEKKKLFSLLFQYEFNENERREKKEQCMQKLATNANERNKIERLKLSRAIHFRRCFQDE